MPKPKPVNYNRFIILIVVVIILTMTMLAWVIIRDRISNNNLELAVSSSKENINNPSLTSNKCDSSTQNSDTCSTINSFDNDKDSNFADIELLVIPMSSSDTQSTCFKLHVKSSYKVAALDIVEPSDIINKIDIKSDHFSIQKFKDKISLLRKIDDKSLGKESNTDLDIGVLCIDNEYKNNVLSVLDDKNFVFFEYGTGESLDTRVVFSN